MTARDDYPQVDEIHTKPGTVKFDLGKEAQRALDEIDRLRAEIDQLRSITAALQIAAIAASYDHALVGNPTIMQPVWDALHQWRGTTR